MILNRFLTASAVIPLALLVLAGPGAAKAGAASPQPMAYGQDRDHDRNWEMAPGEFNEIQRRGFHDGVEGARRDFGNHRQPNVNNREEYRYSHDRPYRDGFRRGYEIAASHLWGGPPPPPVPQPQPAIMAPPPHQDWDGWAMRGLASDAERRGYHEGVEQARNDFQSQRRQDPDDHPEFRNPPVPPPMAGEFREGFMRGYEVATSQLSGEPAWENHGQPGRWAPPERFNEWQRRGFQDGAEGARRDHDNNRRPDVANRDEYREPRVPREFWHDYREGFRRGYEMSAAQIWGGM